MSDLESLFPGPNAGYVLELYERYLADPNSVDPATRSAFAEWRPTIDDGRSPATEDRPSSLVHRPEGCTEEQVTKIVATARIARLTRELGHLTAHIDPLGSPPPGDPELRLENQ